MYYGDREQADHNDRSYDLIIRDQEPFQNSNEENNVPRDVAVTNNASLANTENNLLNNVVLSLDSQRFTNNVESNFRKKVNNVRSENTDEAASCSGASYDVNLCPTDEKSNLNQRFYPKVMKADLEVMIRNNLTVKNDCKDDEDDSDSVHKLKVNLSKNNFS